MAFKYLGGDWVALRKGLSGRVVKFDLHRSIGKPTDTPYWERMDAVYSDTLEALKAAQADDVDWLFITHGHSTSYGRSQTTSRSVVRGLMRSTASTPYVRKVHVHPASFLLRRTDS